MNILYFDWNSFCRKDVLSSFHNLGHTYTLCSLSDTATMLGLDSQTIQNIYEQIVSSQYDFVFTMNYFPMISEACQKASIPYISWIYDNPYMKGYAINIINSCNYIFTFDSAMYEDLSAQGVQTIYYAPMAANVERLTNVPFLSEFGCHDISFVGSMYDEDHNFYDEFVKNARSDGKEYDIGFIDALIQLQLNLYGTNILANSLPKNIATSGYASINEWSETNAYFTTPEKIFSDNVLCRKITAIERKKILEMMSDRFDTALFTRNKQTKVGKCINYGYVDYTTQMPAIFRQSKINLNVSLKSIKTGIPLRAMEIMGCGGFLLTNYQSDYLLHFEPDKDFVYYESLKDAVEKATYYLQNEKERNQIANNALNKMREYHTYEKRINDILSLVFG